MPIPMAVHAASAATLAAPAPLKPVAESVSKVSVRKEYLAMHVSYRIQRVGDVDVFYRKGAGLMRR
jgi:hypothetical protein